MDEVFLRAAAALQANLKLLESQQDVLDDFQDMQALRRFKTDLTDYIASHAAKGELPPDPLAVIIERVKALDGFFQQADTQTKQLLKWKFDWLEKIPLVGITDLTQARAELADMESRDLPALQASLCGMLDSLDWQVDETNPALHPELRICAELVSGITLPSAESCAALYDFAHGTGKLHDRVRKHFRKTGRRIEELIQLHSQHAETLRQAEDLIARHDIRSAQKLMDALDQEFADLPYASARDGLDKLLKTLGKFQALEKKCKSNDWKQVEEDLALLPKRIAKPDSELGRECHKLLENAQKQLAEFVAKRKSQRVRYIATAVILHCLIVGFFASIVFLGLQADRERAEVQAKAERERAEIRTRIAAEVEAGAVGKAIEFPLPDTIPIAFMYCPAGSFTMGSPASEDGRYGDENQVRVTLSKGFWLAKTEVTQAQWQAVMGANPSRFKGVNLPVESVSWDDAREFIGKINASGVLPAGWKMALPTEAQWEYACRAGASGPYSGGAIGEVAWYNENSGSNTHVVGTKKPNAWGLYDMHGNVWEWCADRHGDELPGGADPTGVSSGVNRVLRGGSWGNSAASCRAAYRGWNLPDNRNHDLGFRPALVPSD